MNLLDKAYAQVNQVGYVTGVSSLGELVSKIASWVSIIAGTLAFFYLIYSGILYLTAGGNADQAKKAQQGILNAIIGIIIIALAYAIVNSVSRTFTGSSQTVN